MEQTRRWNNRYVMTADICMAVVTLLALFSLTAWGFRIQTITDLRRFFIPMAPPAGFCLLFLSASYFLPAMFRRREVRWISLLLAVLVGAFSAAVMWARFTGSTLDVQSISPFTYDVFVEGTNEKATYASPITYPLLVLGSIALFLRFYPERAGWIRTLTTAAALVTGLLSLSTLLGYLYGTPFLYAGATRPIALTASVSFLLLGEAIVLEAGRDSWPVSAFVGGTIRARLMRTFLPAAAVLVVIEGLLVSRLSTTFDPGQMALLTSVAMLLVLAALGTLFVNIVGGSMDRVEEQLHRTVEELKVSNSELEQFAYVASHDLQEPLRTVASYVQLVGKRYGDLLDDSGKEFMFHAQDGARRMQALIDDLLEFSRAGTRDLNPDRLDTNNAVKAALANLETTIRETGAEVTSDPLPVITADASQMVQVLQNLIGNGIKFRGEKAPRIHVGARDAADEWEFSVRDNGIGINPRYAGRIFQIFQRLHSRDKYEGTGIGLAITRRIVERHGGRVWFASEPGAGSTFFFTIPKIIPLSMTKGEKQ